MLSEVYKQYHMTVAAERDRYGDTWIPNLIICPRYENRAIFFPWPPADFASETEAESFAIQQSKQWAADHSAT
jgi:hypothetical protein